MKKALMRFFAKFFGFGLLVTFATLFLSELILLLILSTPIALMIARRNEQTHT